MPRKKIRGNVTATLQVKPDQPAKNAIGEAVIEWKDAVRLTGWLGMQSADSRRTYNAKLEESTHCFLCDFDSNAYALASRDTRMIIKGFVYDVLMIDNPDEMDEQLEIYLKKVGSWNG